MTTGKYSARMWRREKEGVKVQKCVSECTVVCDC